MDNMFHLRQDMTNEELQRFAQDRMQKEETIADYMQQREAHAQMDLAQLTQKPQVKQVAQKPMVADMPTLAADEKDWKRKRKMKQTMQPQAAVLQEKGQEIQQKFDARVASIQQKQAIDAQGKAMFEATLRADMLTPKYVMEHFSEVRYMLDNWKRHIALFDEGGAANGLMAEDQKIRLVHMKEMYQQGERAFETALGALGFKYHPELDAKKQFEELTKEQQEQALQDNIAVRTTLAKDAASMDRTVANELIEKEVQRRKPEILAFREEMREKYPFIESENMTHDYEYDETAKIKEMFEKHPTEYAQNKEVLDKLYKEFFNLMEYNGTCYEVSRTIGAIQFDDKTVSSSKMQMLVNIRLEDQEKKMARIRSRAASVMDGIRHILLGKKLPESSYHSLKDFIPIEYNFSQEAQTTKEQSAVYSTRYEEKKEIFNRLAGEIYGDRAQELTAKEAGKYMLFMENDKQEQNEAVVRALLSIHVNETMQGSDDEAAEESAKEIGRIMKPLVMPYLERMRDYDTRELGHYTEEELMARNEELQELSLISMQIAEAAKYRDPDDAEGRSIRDAFCADKKELFDMKCSVIQSYAQKARGLYLVKAYSQGSLDESCFMPAEREEMRKKAGSQPTDPLTMEQMLQGAKEIVEKADVARAAAYKTYYMSPAVQESYTNITSPHVETTHPEYHKQRMDAYKAGLSMLNAPGKTLNSGQLEDFYNLCSKKIRDLKKELDAQEEPGMGTLEIRAQIEELERYQEYTRMQYTLTGKAYVRTGDENSLLREPIFRSYDSAENLPAFQNMSDADFAVMCKKLAAGTFAEDKENPERFEAYYEENMEGLRMYKQRMSEHYEMLETIFHHRIPSIEYIQENRRQLEQWFSNIQVDNHMVEYMRDLIDLTDPADLRLYNLVVTYNAIGGYIVSISTMIALVGADYKEADAASSLPSMEAAEFTKQLDQEQAPVQKDRETLEAELAELEEKKDTYADQKEWLKKKEAAQSPLMIEKFRKIAEDARHIGQEDEQTQLVFLSRMKELADYIKEYEGVPSMNIKQFKGWLNTAQCRLPFIVKGMYYSRPQESDQVNMLDSADILRKELESGDPERFFNAVLEVGKMHTLFSSADVDSSVLNMQDKNSAWTECHETELTLGLDRIEFMPETFQKQFIEAYYRKKESLMGRVNEAVQNLMRELPEQMEDKDGYATYLIMQTQLGREYEALRVMPGTYFRNEPMMEQTVAFKENHEDLLQSTGQMDEKIVAVNKKYAPEFEKIGYTKAVGAEYLGAFRRQFVEKEAAAKIENPAAGADSFDIMEARNIARDVAGQGTLPELAKQLSEVRLTEEMLTPEYMTLHAVDLFASFKTMDAYEAMLRENPALEETVPAAQKFIWEKNKRFYTKYRSYVEQFARSRCVDAVNGEYLTKETYEAEKEEIAENLSKEKAEMSKLMGGFGDYSQKVGAISKQVEGIEKLKKKDKTAVLKSLTECGDWLKDLTRYLAQPLTLSPEDFFDATLMTLMSMFGYIEKNLREARNVLERAEKIGDVSGLVSGIQEISGTFTEFKERIPGIAQEFRAKAMEAGGDVPLTLLDVVVEAQEMKTFHVEGQRQNVGQGASDVKRLQEGEKVFYFKGDEYLKGFIESANELLPMLQNAELREVMEKRLSALEKHGTDIDMRTFANMIVFVRDNGTINESRYTEWNELFKGNPRQLIEADLENWKEFAKGVSQKFVTVDTALAESLLLDRNADMTARNFASERVAELLGQKGLIVRNRDAIVVNEDGVQKKGFIMDQAEGVPAYRMREMAMELGYEVHFTAEAQKKLLNFQIVDMITGQVDRHAGNYFVQYDRDDEAKTLTVKGVTGIDNDFAFGRSVQMYSENTGSIFTDDGKYKFGMMDKEMYQTLMSMSPELLATNLEGVIEPRYMDALKERFETVRQRLKAAKEEADKNGGDFFRERGGWNAESERILCEQPGKASYVKKIKVG